MPNTHGNPVGEPARRTQAFLTRLTTALRRFEMVPPPHPNNGDEALYADKDATYTKALPHDKFGLVDLTAYKSLIKALTTGDPADFEAIILGGPRHQTGPQDGLCFDLEGDDPAALAAPPAPKMASAQFAAEMVEMYWTSMLRDVQFNDYGANAIAAAAAAELSGLTGYAGPRNGAGKVTTNELFRGGFPGETTGPYISQFAIIPTWMGAQSINQQWQVLTPGNDFMKDFPSWLAVQNGSNPTGLTFDSVYRYVRNGRDFSSFTHVDVLYQAYFVALLVLMSTVTPVNPGNPLAGSLTQDGFGTFGGPDFAATVGEVASRAIQAVWYQKWFVHRRARPEVPGAIAHLIKTGQGSKTDVVLSNDLLNSQALADTFAKNGTYLLPQAFPEGSPTHPSYPTGHGTVAGACITVLKFFFDGTFEFKSPMMVDPGSDGLKLIPFKGAPLTVNGELNKLGHNVSFGHGIHAGIHYRSDTDESLKLGEAVALAILQDKAPCYNERFTVNITKFDGTTATISNE